MPQGASDKVGVLNRRKGPVSAMDTGGSVMCFFFDIWGKKKKKKKRGGRVWLRPQRGACEDEGLR